MPVKGKSSVSILDHVHAEISFEKAKRGKGATMEAVLEEAWAHYKRLLDWQSSTLSKKTVCPFCRTALCEHALESMLSERPVPKSEQKYEGLELTEEDVKLIIAARNLSGNEFGRELVSLVVKHGKKKRT